MIINTDAFDYLSLINRQRVLFADIPDNIGLEYEGFDDRKSPGEYKLWVQVLLTLCFMKSEVFWLSYNAMHNWMVPMFLNTMPSDWSYRQIIWRYTFGQYNDHDFTSGYRPIALFRRAPLYLDRIRTVSARMQMGDKRAVGLRIPDDVWEFPRIVGNAKERRAWHVTQHPEDLMQRIILASCMKESFCDLFGGSGTSAIVCKRLGINCTTIELSKYYCEKIAAAVGERYFSNVRGPCITCGGHLFHYSDCVYVVT